MRNGHKTGFARHLRRNMTDAERELWHHLRNRAFMGHKFRRQYPVGPWIVDFACPAQRLVVELDGGQHEDSKDAARTRGLEARGFTVLRFWNNDVFLQQGIVLAVILDALSTPSASRPPAGGQTSAGRPP
ncbi:MAG TPA: endonuclease domain-containing protein [Luteimonas sp.]|nr:endonuclease domain-containing protein [Luteimonas sp.]